MMERGEVGEKENVVGFLDLHGEDDDEGFK